MKLKYILLSLFIACFTTACNTDDADDTQQEVNEVEGLLKVQEISNNTHTIELYNKEGVFKTGYNSIRLRIKDNTTNMYVENATVSWKPIMQMPSMQHSSPYSTIEKSIGKNTVYQGFIVYQMTNTDGSGWSLTIDYSIDGTDYTATDAIHVLQNEKQHVTSFMANDAVRYVLALVEPESPIIGVNTLKVALFRMESMMTFSEVEDYTISLDPRMPGMGNHSSPNNTDLSYSFVDKLYHGDLSLTMTGYWVLNLKLMNTLDEILKGETVTEDNPQSSLYLELEF
ncbi:hypothetical protein [Flavobacteriaceae bacterium A100]|uniref:hypothetical protein n=1 Tax=Oceanihabitans sediminis TaxID=1812012 RepID=UPI0009315EEE